MVLRGLYPTTLSIQAFTDSRRNMTYLHVSCESIFYAGTAARVNIQFIVLKWSFFRAPSVT